MTKKRDHVDIIEDMLLSIQSKGGEIKPTHLMYKSNLSHVQMKSYLEELLEKEFIQKVKKNEYDYITITVKGCEFLNVVHKMKEFDKTFGI